MVDKKESIHEFHKDFISIVVHQDKEIGFVSITKINEGLNIGTITNSYGFFSIRNDTFKNHIKVKKYRDLW